MQEIFIRREATQRVLLKDRNTNICNLSNSDIRAPFIDTATFAGKVVYGKITK